ncbi:MAG TPA: type II toxin-antitoxin system VapC family toxin [Thermodesulfobacteriota bacterium]|nr:type II toxin-antitoxin system VapC family toxin [Thermodesulfobacteriota bacterium]
MRIIYFDTSALVKRYVEEKGTQTVNALLLSGELITTSILTYPEMKAAFAKKYRLKEMAEESYKKATENFKKDWDVPVFSIIGLTSQVAYLAGALIERNVLRALDATHLASALTAKEHFGIPALFISADDQLNKAAASEGLDVTNPE